MQLIKTISVWALLLFHSVLIAQTNFHQFIDPFIGSEGPGNVFVGPSTPFGMAKPGPDVHLRANSCLLYTSPSPRDRTRSRMPSSA